MSVEPGHEPFDRERVLRPTSQHPVAPNTASGQPAHYNAVRHGNHVEESPDLLRWRADLLMDEMMMGGVDVSAADGNRTFSGVDAPVVQRPKSPDYPAQTNSTQTYTNQNGQYSQGHSAAAGPRPANGHSANGYNHAAPDDRYDSDYRNGENHHGENYNGENRYGEYPRGEYRNGHVEQNGNQYGSQPDHQYDNDHADPRHSSDNYGTYGQEHAQDEPRQSYVRPEDLAHPDDGAGQGYPSPGANHPFTSDTQPAPQNYAPRDHGARDYDARGYGRSYDEGQGARHNNNLPPRTQPAPDRYANGGYESGYVNGRVSQGQSDQGAVDAVYPDARGVSNGYPSGTSRDSDVTRTPPPHSAAQPASQPPRASEGYAPVGDAPESSPQDQPPRNDRLYAVEQQYEQFRREQNANMPPVERPANETSAGEGAPRQNPPQATSPATSPQAARPQAARPPLPPVEPARYPTTPPRITPPPVDEHTQWATGPDKWEYQDFAANPDEEPDDLFAGGPRPPERIYTQDSAVRHDPAQFVSAMSVMNNGKKRSTLLPRSTELDIDTLHREISDLHGEIAALLPVGNETSERARHLLDKAYSILQSDPSRSAEVEYYMQQVRTIVQRLRQSRQWSDLYRQRLHVYLLGWLGLSAMALLARFFFQIDLDNMLMWVTGAEADSWLVAHWSTFVGTAAAGAFGGALGALYTMRGHARGEHSFFDRKYGLRGLILPFMGLIVGMLGYLIFGLVFALVGVNPATSLTIAIIPTTAAFAFGFNQESIYGTRG